MKTINIFYNGREANFPPSNDWESFTGQDSVRLFLLTAETWRRQGWNVKRLSTRTWDRQNSVLPLWEQTFTGRIAREGGWYPAENWQFIAKACTLEPDNSGMLWFATYDTPNFGLHASTNYFDTWFTFSGCGCASFQVEHFSLACFAATPEWLTRAREILSEYDSEKLPRIPGKYTSDETILRHYAKSARFPLQGFPIGFYNDKPPLLHFARSTLAQAYREIDVV